MKHPLRPIRAVHAINALSFGISLLAAGFNLYALGWVLLTWADLAAAALAAGAYGLYRHNRQEGLYAALVALTVFLIVPITYLFATQQGEPNFGVWLFFLPFAAFFLLGLRAGGWVVLALLAVITPYNLWALGNLLGVTDFYTFTVALWLFSLFAWLLERNRTRSIIQLGNLLSEVHHRVRNNLNLISALLGLQAAKEPEAIAARLQIGRDRIDTIAAAHHKLYESENYDRVEMISFLERLSRSTIPINRQIEPVALGLSEAMALGLITHELLRLCADQGAQSVTLFLGSEPKGLLYRFKADLPQDPQGIDPLTVPMIEMMTRQVGGRHHLLTTQDLLCEVRFKPGGDQ